MSITFCIGARSPAEHDALHSEHSPELNVHDAGGWALLTALGIEPDHCGTIAASELLARIDTASTGPVVRRVDPDYIAARLPLLHDVAVTADRLGRPVVWG